MNKFFGHLSTVAKHRHKVFLHCCRAGIPFQGLTHDLSKFSPTEFIPSVKHYQGTRSPNEGEREDYGYSLAWMHHKGRNRHHFEYWTDYDPVTRKMTPVRMPEKYVVEMFCDRVAASKTYKGKDYRDGDPLAYFMRAKPRRQIHPESSDLLEKLLTTLAEEGEDAAFKLAKRIVKKKEA
ncbi:MAG: DUF5662 family protein [Lachnospiraceae bacterium]|nr:DUF5662 family protein [Lachnospiraceae bacterium]